MVKTKRFVYDAVTHTTNMEEIEFIPPPSYLPKGIDFNKLKKILLGKRIIKKTSEIEPDYALQK
jgi:hypothetical protein